MAPIVKNVVSLTALAFLALPVSESSLSLGQDQVLIIEGVPLGPHEPDENSFVGFIDSGVDSEHPQIKGLVIAQKDFTGEGLGDPFNHGTKVVLVYLQMHFHLNDTLEIPEYASKENFLNDRPPGILMAKVIGRKPVDDATLAKRMDAAYNWLRSRKVEMIINTVD